jgi:ZIP family zinc transporter
VLFVLLVSTATGLCTGLGSLPFWFVSSLPRRVYDAVLGFGAGLMLSAATLGLLAESLEMVHGDGHGVEPIALALVLLGFAAGFAILFTVERLIPHEHAGGHREHLREGAHEHEAAGGGLVASATRHVRHGLLISGALVFHRLPEGFAIGASFARGETHPLGFLVAFTVGLQNVCEGMVMAAPLRAGGLRPWRAFLITAATGLTVPVTAAIGFAFSQQVAGAMPFALALAAGSLIGVVSNEIIPETHGHGNEGLATLGIVAGFVFTIVLKVGLGVH